MAHIRDLRPDAHNRRQHNPRNIGMLVDALHEVGAARSIVIDEADTVLAGNGVLEAAAEAGITNVQVVDADGATGIAVRRRDLTEDQKRKLAIYDNRTAELAEWSVDQLRADVADGLTLEPFFTDAEADALLTLPDGNTWAAAAGALPIGERAGFQQVTFTLTDAQVGFVKAALQRAKDAGPFEGTGNENSNGNALARICEAYGRG